MTTKISNQFANLSNQSAVYSSIILH